MTPEGFFGNGLSRWGGGERMATFTYLAELPALTLPACEQQQQAWLPAVSTESHTLRVPRERTEERAVSS